MLAMLTKTQLALIPLGLAFAGAAMLAGAFAFQYIGDMHPCVLCIYQRWPHGLAIPIGIAAWVLRDHAAGPWLAILAGLVLLTGAAIAGFHVGVEYKWWEGTSSCGSTEQPDNLKDLMKMLEAQPIVRCDEVPWSMFGISMAGYNFLISIGLGLAGLYSGLRLRKG